MRRRSFVGAALLGLLGTGCGTPDAAPDADQGAVPDRTVRMWVETDPGGYPDDAYALAILLNTPGVEIVGIGTTGGHGGLRAAWVKAMLTAAGRSVPVYAGDEGDPDAEVPAQLQVAGVSEEVGPGPREATAPEALARVLRESPGEVAVLVLGPATNLAAALADQPDLLTLAREVVMMGGAFEVGYDGRAPAIPEANAAADPQAFRTVLEAASDPVLVPLDLTWSTTLPAAIRDWLESAPPPEEQAGLSAFLADQYRRSERDWGNDHEPVLHDVVATEVLLHPERIQTDPVRLRVEDDGRFVTSPDGIPVRRVTSVSLELILDELARVFDPGDAEEG